MLKSNVRRFVADFETTVYDGQEDTFVWAAAIAELFDKSDKVDIFHSIDHLYGFLMSFDESLICYFHNLKFDGSFWLYFLLEVMHYKQAFYYDPVKETTEWLKDKEMPNHSIKYSISDRGQWYVIVIKENDHIIEFRDSLKLIPFSVREIGESFGVSRKKLDMDYSGYRYPGCDISKKEKEYIGNDVLVVKEALESLFKDGNDRLTIGSCCMSEFKKIYGRQEFKEDFPNLTKCDAPLYTGYKNVYEFTRKSYLGGWCYSVPEKRGIIYHNGVTLDVNSLYSSVMHSISGNAYPYGKPMWWEGNTIPKQALNKNTIYFICVKTRFYLKPGKLPFVQIKGDLLYPAREHLKSSDVYNPVKKEYLREYVRDGKIVQAIPELVLTQMDWELMQEHYNLEDTEILYGCFFYTKTGIFDEYIDKYAKQKATSEGAKRAEAKLFLNNLYGKFGTNINSSFKIVEIGKDGAIKFRTVEQYNKTPGYIPIGSCITSYARCFTIRAAQANYNYFAYADTDSIHCHCSKNKIKGCTIHESNLLCWKLESEWDTALFTRQKTYIEIDKKGWTVKCAGMPDKCKYLFRYSCGDESLSMRESEGKTWIYEDENRKFKIYDRDIEFLSNRNNILDFKVGLNVPGKLSPKRIRGGTLLVEGEYEMRKSAW